ncbi:hypothetical protein ACWA2C_16220 [Priestia megaterium]
MEMVVEYLFLRYTKIEPLSFPDYLLPRNRHKNDFWITIEGQCIYPTDMDDRHLLNTVRLIHRNIPHLEELYEEADSDRHIIYGLAPWSLTSKTIIRKNYVQLWTQKRIYMLLRREIKLRKLEEQL